MKIRTLFLLFILSVIAIFVWINWNEFLKQTTLNLLFEKIQAPLGLIMLVLLGLLTLIFFVYALYLRSELLIKERQFTKNLGNAEELAEKAEQSRCVELREFIKTESEIFTTKNKELFETILVKINKLDDGCKSILSELRKVN